MDSRFKTLFLFSVAIFLLIGCFDQPYGYYNFLRTAVFTSCILLFFWNENNPLLDVVFILLALLYNPMITVYLLEKSYWCYVDVLVAGTFVERGVRFYIK